MDWPASYRRVKVILTLSSKITTIRHKGLRWFCIAFSFETPAGPIPGRRFSFSAPDYEESVSVGRRACDNLRTGADNRMIRAQENGSPGGNVDERRSAIESTAGVL
jgi:hypothetical protein